MELMLNTVVVQSGGDYTLKKASGPVLTQNVWGLSSMAGNKSKTPHHALHHET